MTKRALVLGGGGPVGIAWESGLIAGLAREGVDLGVADLFIGTSAGSVVGAQLAIGRTPEQLVARHLATEPEGGTQPRPVPGGQAAPNLMPLMQLMARLAGPGADTDAIRREIGAFALNAPTISEEEFIAGFGLWLAEAGEWPARDFICTAVDCLTGDFVGWDRASRVNLAAAVASSCSVPGIYPPITLNGRRYMDGGMRSGTNADLAKGYDSVLVIAVSSGRAAPNATPAMMAMAESGRKRLEGELDALRLSGSKVELLVPDDEAVALFGPNLMDYTRRTASAETGLRQGSVGAAALDAFWE